MKFKMSMHSQIESTFSKKKNIFDKILLYLIRITWKNYYDIHYIESSIEIFTTRKFTFPLNASGILRVNKTANEITCTREYLLNLRSR